MTFAWCPLCAADRGAARVEVHDHGWEPHGDWGRLTRSCGPKDGQRDGPHLHFYCACGFDWGEDAGTGSDSPGVPR